jgi:choline dehydrogenase
MSSKSTGAEVSLAPGRPARATSSPSSRSNAGRASEPHRRLLPPCVAAACLRCTLCRAAIRASSLRRAFQYPISKVFVDAARQTGLPITDDLSAPPYDGVGPYQHTIANGRRCSAADGYLHPVMSRPNLTVKTGAYAVSIDFDGKRAAGVTYESGGHRTSIKANREVIVSAGAYISPQLLMLSGVGDPDELKANGIKLVHPLPGVGKNLMEHPAVFLQNLSHGHAGVQLSLVGMLEMMGQGIEYYGANAGKLRASAVESGGFLKTDPALPRPNIQLMFEPMLFDFASQNIQMMRQHGYSCHIAALNPKSRGTVGLASADPSDPPVIDFRLLRFPCLSAGSDHAGHDRCAAALPYFGISNARRL